MNNRTPALTYGIRGLVYLNVIISGPSADLHSGMFGGTIFEPMTTLITLLSKLVTPDGHILVPGVYDNVPQPTPDEM